MLQFDAETPSQQDWSCCTLHKVARFLHSTLKWEELVEEVLDVVLEVTGSQRALLLLNAPDGDEFQVGGLRNMDEAEVAEAKTFCRRSMAAATLSEMGENHDRVIGKDRAGLRLCLLLWVWGRAVGVLYLDDSKALCPGNQPSSPFYTALADQVAIALENVRRYSQLQQENVQLRQEVEGGSRFASILGNSRPMQQMKRMLEKVIDSPASVLIIGESGTGKELVARALHYEGPRKERAFVAENCAALPESLLESELFGHTKGAYTGAHDEKPGLFEVANDGTLFLDEIADTSPAVQAKLLRVLENGEIRRLGEIETRQVQVRVVAATSRDLLKAVEEDRFRPELYYRLSVLTVNIPPLRERCEDIPLLANHFLADYAWRTGKRLSGISQEVIAVLKRYLWPGNVRQLRNEVERMAALVDEGKEIAFELLSNELRGIQVSSAGLQGAESLPLALERIKKTMIEEALRGTEGNRTRAAERLGISRPNLQKMMKRLGVS